MKTAPKLNEVVHVTDRVTPLLTLPVVAVLGYDTEHDAWQIATEVACDRRCESRHYSITDYGGTHTMWIRRVVDDWVLYNINAPLAAA